MNAPMPDYDDPAVEEQWCDARRSQVLDYLDREGVRHGRVGDWPAWHLAPYVSVWAIESAKAPGWVGWWVICGDLPTDYVSSAGIRHPRHAVRAIAERWGEVAAYMERGETHPSISIGGLQDSKELAPLLRARSELLANFADDDGIWPE